MFQLPSRRVSQPGRHTAGTRRDRRQRRGLVCPQLEALEDRTLPAVSLLNSFLGLNVTQVGGYVPPDSNGAAGVNRYVATANQALAIYNKTDGSTAALDTFDDFWFTQGALSRQPAGSTSGISLSDPIVVWDQQIQRFIVGDQYVDFTATNDGGQHASEFLLAVSRSADPATLTAADWNFYAVNTTENAVDPAYQGKNFDADYPGNFGYNHDAFVFTLNMFPVAVQGGAGPDHHGPDDQGTGGGGSAIGHVQINSINIQDLANGASQANLHVYRSDFAGSGLRPTVMHDSVAGDPMWLVTEHGDDQSIDVIQMTNVLSAYPGFTTTNLPVNPYTDIGTNPPQQPAESPLTFNVDSRIQQAAEQGGILVAAHSVSNLAHDRGLARWYSIDVSSGTPRLKDQGDVTSAATGAGSAHVYDCYPGIDVNPAGDVALSYMQSSHTGIVQGEYMGMYVTARAPTDPPGNMETPFLVQAGQAINTDGRAGDLSGLNVDANGSFWAINEFTDFTGNWNTAVAHFSLGAGCTMAATLDSAGNLVVTDTTTPRGASGDNVTLQADLAHQYYVITNPNGTIGSTLPNLPAAPDSHTLDVPFGIVTGAQIQVRQLGGLATLTVDYSLGSFAAAGDKTIVYDGGSGLNTLNVTGASFSQAQYDYGRFGSGDVQLTDAAGTTSIQYAELQTLNNRAAVASDAFQLPDASVLGPIVNDAFLVDGAGAQPLALVSLNDPQFHPNDPQFHPRGTFPTTTFTSPSQPLTILPGTAEDNFYLDGVTHLTTSLSIGSAARPFQTASISRTVTLTNGSLVVNTSAEINLVGDGTVLTQGSQTYNGPIIVRSDKNLTSTGGGNLTFTSTIDDDASSRDNFVVDTAGAITFAAAVGGSSALGSLTTSGGGSTYLGGNVTTADGPQTYGNPLVLTSNVTLTDNGQTGIAFLSRVDSDGAATPRSLTVTVTDPQATITGTGTVGGGNALNVLTVNDQGAAALNGSLAGAAQLVKNGTGTLALTNASNPCTGTTSVNAGTLDVQGALTGAGGDVTLANGTTLTSSNGQGRITGRTVVVPAGVSNATVSNLRQITHSGTSAVSVAGSATLTGNTISGSTSGVDVSGSATLTGNTLSGNTTGLLVHNGGSLTLGSNNVLTGGMVGLRVDGPTATIAGLTVANTAFRGQGAYCIQLTNAALTGPQILDATSATFEGIPGSSLNAAALANVEARLYDFHVASTVGLVVVKPGVVLPASPNLVVVGVLGNNLINVNGANPAQVMVYLNGRTQGGFNVSRGRVLVLGGSGNDYVNITGPVDAEVHGGAGNDVILGGSGRNILIGGPGNDYILGRGSADVLVGGGGRDTLLGSGGKDVLIAGRLLPGYNTYAYLDAVRTEWLATTDTTKAMLHALAQNGVSHADDPADQSVLSHTGGASAFLYKKKGSYNDRVSGRTSADADLGF